MESLIEYHYALIDAPALNAPQRVSWENCALLRKSLMKQSVFGHVGDPWLVELNTFQIDFPELGKHALQGWCSSFLPLTELADHLGKALVAQDEYGQSFLVRSYAASVLPLLHEREDCPWHAWLFGPINYWWIPSHGDIQRYSGLGLKTLPDFSPIQLDSAFIGLLSVDHLAMTMLHGTQKRD